MPANGLSTGIDVKMSFNDIDGVQQFAILKNFQAKEDSTVDQRTYIDGKTRHPKFHKGWSGSFTTDRTNNVIDRYFALQEASYYAGRDQLPMTITQTITETDGSVTQYQFIEVVLVYDDAGTWSGEEVVSQSISFQASRRLLRV
jgi:hypothetical protein